MQASKVRVSDETLLSAGNLSPKRKVELREQRVIDYIASKPYGTRITTREFAPVVGIDQSMVVRLLRDLVKRGKIDRTLIGPTKSSGYSYTVPGQLITRKIEPTYKKPSVEPAKKLDPAKTPPKPQREATADTVLQLVEKLKALGVEFDIRITNKREQ